MKHLLKEVTTQKELGTLIQKHSKDNAFEETLKECGAPLSVNDASSVAKAVSDTVKIYGYNNFYNNIIEGVNRSKCKPEKTGLAIEVVIAIFKDYNRWAWFSHSKKMMKRVIKNDKTPEV